MRGSVRCAFAQKGTRQAVPVKARLFLSKPVTLSQARAEVLRNLTNVTVETSFFFSVVFFLLGLAGCCWPSSALVRSAQLCALLRSAALCALLRSAVAGLPVASPLRCGCAFWFLGVSSVLTGIFFSQDTQGNASLTHRSKETFSLQRENSWKKVASIMVQVFWIDLKRSSRNLEARPHSLLQPSPSPASCPSVRRGTSIQWPFSMSPRHSSSQHQPW